MRKPEHIESLYIDFDAFFANVEKQLEPGIRDRPVGVTALDSEHSALITRCYKAKAAGVKRGTRVSEARELCPDIAIRVARPDEYVKIHHRILGEINRHVPVWKVWSIDEAECRLIGSERDHARELANRIRAGLAENIGPYVTGSIGLAPNGLLSKIAAEMNKPNGLTILHPNNLPGALLDLDLSNLPGISTGMITRLQRSGIHDVAGLWNISGKHARKIWNSVEGERFRAQLHGYDVVRPETHRRMFGHSRVLTRGWQTPDKALDCLNLLTVKAAYRLRREGYLCRALSLSFRLKDGCKRSDGTEFPACSDDPTLLAYMHHLFRRNTVRLPASARLKTAAVMLHDIARPSEVSEDLFAAATKPVAPEHWDKVMQTMDGLNEKFGRAVIHIGSRSNLPGGYAGGKIAFGRVPEKEDFF